MIDNFYKQKVNSKTFTEHNLNKIFYYKKQKAYLFLTKKTPFLKLFFGSFLESKTIQAINKNQK